MRFVIIIFLVVSAFLNGAASGQCIVINEVMVNAAGGCDGSCNPSTSEWTELYNTCSTPVDISCYVLTDGDFAITIPNSTTIPPNGYYVIGSVNSGGTVNLDLATCGCTSGGSIGTFTNSGEQLILTDKTGAIQDAIYWGGGQFPVSITSGSSTGCTPVSVNAPSPTSVFESLTGQSGNDGCTAARQCDGSSIWVTRCGSAISLGVTNGPAPIPKFTVSDSVICTGSCINFTDLSTGSPSGWSWTFTGGATASSSSQSPNNICYNTSGSFDVKLQVTNSCGSFSLTKPQYIKVSNGTAPVITASGPVNFCAGDSVTLQTIATGTCQWKLNGGSIAGATGKQYTARASGTYTVTVSNGSCTATSNAIVVTVSPAPVAVITPSGPTSLCAGGSVSLDGGAGFTTYQWQLNGTSIPGATSRQCTASAGGDYQLIVSNIGGCGDTSAVTSVTVLGSAPPAITSATGKYAICPGQTLILNAGAGYSTYQWYLNAGVFTGATASQYTTPTAGDYSVIVTSSGGCTDTSLTVQVTVSGLPVAAVNPGGPISNCGSAPVILQASGGAAYQWLMNNSIIGGATTASYSVSSDGDYSAIAVNATCCLDTSNAVSVSFLSAPSVSISATATELCEGQTTNLSIIGTYTTISWSTGDATPDITVSETGNYTVTVTNTNGCSATDDELVAVSPLPEAYAGADKVNNCGSAVQLNGTGNGSFSWQPVQGLSDATASNPLASPGTATTYTLTVTNGPCTSTDEVVVLVTCESFGVPTAFSPNHDGINDFFKAIGNDIDQFNMKIFDRWGELVYETNYPDKGWDGTFKNQAMPVGVYVWRITATNSAGKKLLVNGRDCGNLTLLR